MRKQRPYCASAGAMQALPEALRIVPIVGTMSAWNGLIEDAFFDGAEAVVLLGDGITPANGALAALAKGWSANPHAVLGGNVFDAEWPHYLGYAEFCRADATWNWQREICIEFITDRIMTPPQPADWLTSAALLIPAAIWKAVGGFDARLGSFFADVDWCMRARNAGFACLNVREARFASMRSFRPLNDHSAAEHRRKTLMLARNHAVPRGLLTLAFRHLALEIKGELGRVKFWADYGESIGLPRRVLWFLQNTYTALLRKRLLTTVGQIVLDTWTLLLRNELPEVE